MMTAQFLNTMQKSTPEGDSASKKNSYTRLYVDEPLQPSHLIRTVVIELRDNSPMKEPWREQLIVTNDVMEKRLNSLGYLLRKTVYLPRIRFKYELLGDINFTSKVSKDEQKVYDQVVRIACRRLQEVSRSNKW